MKRIALLAFVLLLISCKTSVSIFNTKETTVEEKIAEIKEENRLPEEKDVPDLPDYAQIRDDFRSVSDKSREEYLNGMKANEEHYSVVILTKGFKGENINIKNDHTSFFKGMVMSDLKSGIAKSVRIDNTEDFTLFDGFTEGQLTIESDHAKMFKFIYVMKNNADKESPFKVTFSNTLRPVR